MMSLIRSIARKYIVGDPKEDPEIVRQREETIHQLQEERGEFRQSLQRLASQHDVMMRTGLLMSWEGASRMLEDKTHD